MTEETQPKPPSALSMYIYRWGILLLTVAIKAIVVLFLINLILPVLIPSAPTLEYGHSFILCLLIHILAIDVSGERAKRDVTIYTINTNLTRLVNNQLIQNGNLLLFMNKILTAMDANKAKDVEFVTLFTEDSENVDNESQKDYNKKDSENV